MLTLIFNVWKTAWKIYGTCITQNCKMSYSNYIVKYGTRYFSLRTSRKYVRTSNTKGATCGVETTYPFGSYVFTQVSWWGSWCSFFGSLSHLLNIVLSFILLLFYRQTFPTRTFLLLDVELANLCSLRNFDLCMLYVEFVLE